MNAQINKICLSLARITNNCPEVLREYSFWRFNKMNQKHKITTLNSTKGALDKDTMGSPHRGKDSQLLGTKVVIMTQA